MTDAELLTQFEAAGIGSEQWTHRAHVKVAYLYLREHPFDVALTKIRTGIKKLNAANKVPEGPMMGYNETTTHAYTHLIAAVMSAYRQTHPVDSADSFYDMHPQFQTKHILRLFYSPERRRHPLAKTEFVEPDLAPLPTIIS